MLVYTDHANLCYYQDPRKIGPRVTRYLPEHKQYNMLLKYKPGATNCVDKLSRRQDHDTGENPLNNDVTVWLDKYFCEKHTRICITDWDLLEDTIEQQCKWAQYKEQNTLK
jgi:hypothetical protein